MRIAINGLGRIGRTIFRILAAQEEIEIAAINDISDPTSLGYLMRYDTIMGTFPGRLTMDDSRLITDRHTTRVIREPDPARLPWRDEGIDVVIESSGVFRDRDSLTKHLEAGAGRVILTVPPKDEIDYMVVLGVNESALKPEHRLISNASCTTNCLAPLARILHETFGIVEGAMNTVHAYTNDQRLADVYHSDLRRSRAAAENIIPTSTGAAKAVGQILPELDGRLDGIASRVPVADGSVVDLFVELGTSTSRDDVHAAIREAADSEALSHIVEYADRPIVSSDIIGNPHSCIFDAGFTHLLDGRFLKTLSWYDNEWGYSSRIHDLLRIMRQWQ
jgi:glyceraldehyde 3-phosphate dehydrogenase